MESSGGSSTRTTDGMVIRTGGAPPPLPVAPSRKRIFCAGDRPVDCVQVARLLFDSKHRDGSFASDSTWWHKLYRMSITDETCLEPMMLSKATHCWPNSRECQSHSYAHMMQIYSLKLAYISADNFDGPIQLYGFMAARDLLNPRRNYVFNCTRGDPFTVVQDDNQFILLSGPKRGIEMISPVVIEFDMRIKIGEKEEDDLQLIDGAVCFSDMASLPDTVYTRRIVGDCGAVDISLALLIQAAEATIQVGISEVCDSGLSLCLTACGSELLEIAHLFDGVITEPCDLNRFVFAVVENTKLILVLKVGRSDCSDRVHRFHLFDVRKHGDSTVSFKLDFATVHVKVTWSTLDVPNSALGEDNHYKWDESFYKNVDYDYRWDDY